MICTKCNSENTQKLSIAYSSGLSEIDTKTSGAGIGLTASGNVGVGVGAGSTSGTQQTYLSRNTSPPTKFSYVKFIWAAFTLFVLGIIFGGIILMLFGAPRGVTGVLANLFAASLIIFSIYRIYKGYIFNKNIFPGAMKFWQNGYICLRCGNIFSTQ